MSSNAASNPIHFVVPRYAWCIFIILWLILMLTGRSAMFRDPGTFWHVVVGEKILSTAQVPREDIYSFTRNGQPWIADQWLADIAMAAVYRLAGWDGLLTITAAILAAIFALIAERLLRSGVHWLLTGMILALILLASSHQFHVRPLVLTLAGLTITFSLLVDVESGRNSPHRLWLLAPLFILWANLHGGVLAGLGSVILCSLGWFLLWATGKDSPIRNYRHALEILLLVSILVSGLFINPYGAKLVQSWFETLTMPLPSLIQEHGPINLTTPLGWATLCLGMIYIIVLLSVLWMPCPRWVPCPRLPWACWNNQKPSPFSSSENETISLRITWLLPLVFFALALRVRNAPLFAITAALALPDMLPHSRLATWLQRRNWFSIPETSVFSPGTRDGRIPRNLIAWLLSLSLFAIALSLQAAKISLPVLGSGWACPDPDQWPIDLLPELKKISENNSPSDQRIFNDLKFGGFLIYHTPNLKVYIDDRCPLYSSEFLWQYDAARRDNPRQIDLWRQEYQFRHALVEADGPFDHYLQRNSQWTLLGRSVSAALYRFNL